MNIILDTIADKYDELKRIAGYYTVNDYEASELLHYTIDYIMFTLKSESRDNIIKNNNVIPYCIKVMQSFSLNNRYSNVIAPRTNINIADFDLSDYDIEHIEYNDLTEKVKEDKSNEFKAMFIKVLSDLVDKNELSKWKKELFILYYYNGNLDKFIKDYRLTDVMVNRTKNEIETILINKIKYGK